MSLIHPTAQIAPGAQLDSSVEVGAFSVIGPDVRIDAGTVIGPHVVIEGKTTLGRDNRVFQFASVGAAPQDKKYRGEPTGLRATANSRVLTLNRGTVQDAADQIGDDN
jgi:UDP-N-acetylglucosamine acyltransferase